MANFGSYDLPVDWLRAPKAPVLFNGASYSVNFDDYGDTDADMGHNHSEYTNIPPVFTNQEYLDEGGPQTAVITPSHTPSDFMAAYAALPAGGCLRLQDGTYDWDSADAGNNAFVMDNTSGSPDNPIYVLAESPAGAKFVNAVAFSLMGYHHVIGGLHRTGGDKGTNYIAHDRGFNRVTGCKFEIADPHAHGTGAHVRMPGGPYSGNTETDNCEFVGTLNWDDSMRRHMGIFILCEDNPGTYARNKTHRIHHNTFRDGSGEIQSSRDCVTLGTYQQNMCIIFENNAADTYVTDDEFVTNKSRYNILRNNKLVNNGRCTLTERKDGNSLYHGNWIVGQTLGMRMIGERVHQFFNYWATRGDGVPRGAAMKMYPRVDHGEWDGCDYSLNKHNVFSGFDHIVEVDTWPGSGSPDQIPTGNAIADNLFYHSGNLVENDNESANYLGEQYSHAEYRAANPLDTGSTFMQPDLPLTTAITASLFDGPGADLVDGDDYNAADIYGQPSIIKMPSWWKQS